MNGRRRRRRRRRHKRGLGRSEGGAEVRWG
jgi:hypothetical protein